VLEGHSYHGEAFNEGPRQSAYLMKGMGHVRFPVTTSAQEAQLFFTQGVAQLHGFWHFEAERSFRQAAMLDPDCAMAYWGMAVANRGNTERAQGFIEEAKKRRDKAGKREQLWIDSEVNYWADTKKAKKDRRRKMIRDLESIIFEYPDDIEAKAFLAVWMWQSAREGLPIHSHGAVTALIEDVLDVEPMHPCHHFRIHLWDNEKPARALASAARCGQGDATLSIQVKPNNIGHPRLGISVSKKVSSSAVKRNYIKRQIREWFRHQQHTLGGIDFIVVARRQSKDASVTTIHSALFNQWQIVKDKQCAE